jgi:hypothetical protein
LTTASRPALADLIALARENYSGLDAIPLDESISPETFYRATPSPLGYAYAWILAAEIVDARFLTSAVDVLPVFHPENGWDRFLITRRVSAAAFQYQPANEYGMLLLNGEGNINYTSPGGRLRVAVGAEIDDDPHAVVQAVLSHIRAPRLGAEPTHRFLEYEEAPSYPRNLRAVAELIVENPGLTAAREIYIDDEEIDGQFHPLHLHAVELTGMGPDDRHGANVATTTYRWFQLQMGDLFAFFDKRGNRAVYRTDRGTWSRVKQQLDKEESLDDVKNRIRGWMRIEGAAPDDTVD